MTDARSDSAQTGSRAERAKTAISEGTHAARESIEESYRAARDRAKSAYDDASETVEHAYDAAKRGARRAARKTSSGVDAAPLAVLVGGLAVGAVAGALLPRTRREEELLAPLGHRLTETAAAAARAARVAGQDRLDALGLNADNAKAQASSLLDGVVKAATDAGAAAAAEVRGGGQG